MINEYDLPAHPEDFKYLALLRNHDMKQTKWIVVPHSQSLDFDEDSADRKWLRPYLGTDWHLFDFVESVNKVSNYKWKCPNFIADPCGSASCASCGKRRHEHK